MKERSMSVFDERGMECISLYFGNILCNIVMNYANRQYEISCIFSYDCLFVCSFVQPTVYERRELAA